MQKLVKKEYQIPFILVTSLFFLWGFAHAILDVLNKHFQDVMNISRAHSAWVQVICPLGVFQDAISWVSGKRKKNRFRYSPAMKWLRYGVLAVFIIAMIVGLNALAILIAPYSAYGRMVSALFAPVWQWGNNLLAYFAERAAYRRIIIVFGRR